MNALMKEDAIQRTAPAGAAATVQPVRRVYGALFVLWLIHAIANIDRFSIGLIAQSIKADLALSDTQIGVFTGAAFVVAYVVAGFPMARWLDRGCRVRILAWSLALWSLMTAACGLAVNFVQIVLARAGVGAGESSCVPGALSLIGDYFPPEKRAQAIGIFQSALPAAGIVGTPIIGFIADQYGWRAALYAMGLAGTALAVLAYVTLREPLRSVAAPAPVNPAAALRGDFLQDLRKLWALPALRHLLIAHGLYGIGIFSFVTWYPISLVRIHGLSYTELGLFAGTGLGIVMFLTTIGSGYLGPAVVRRTGDERWLVWLPALYAVASVPALFAASADATLLTALLAGGAAFALTIARAPLILTLSMNLVPASMHSLTTLVFLLVTNIVGSAVGPLLTGIVSDALAPSLGAELALRHALLWTAPTFCLLGSALAFLPARYMKKEISR